MKTLFASLLALLPLSLSAQLCNHVIPIHAVSQGTGSFHITSDVTMPFNDGSNFYVCAGVHLTIEGSAGCNYYLEEGAMLTIEDQDGDNVFAKGNCVITDLSTETLVVTSESSTTISKPNAPFNLVQLTCTNMVYDYQLVGGSAPCSLDLEEESQENVQVYPNPATNGQEIHFSATIAALTITDFSGRIVRKEVDINDEKLVIETIEAGTYLLHVVKADGTNATTRLQIQ